MVVVHTLHGPRHKVLLLVECLDGLQAVQCLGNQGHHGTRAVHAQLLQVSSSRHVEGKHDSRHDEETASQCREQRDDGGHGDGSGHKDEAIDTCIVQGIWQCLVLHILVLGERDKEVTDGGLL